MMQFTSRCFSCFFSMLLLCATANADFLISEPPDFGITFGGPSSGTLGLGVNEIAGNLSFDGIDGDFADVVAITLPEGLEIVSFELTVSNFEGLPGATFILSHTWLQGVGFIDGMSISGNGTTQFPEESLHLLVPGTYDFQQALNGSFITAYADWQLTVTTSAIPEPGPITVLGLIAVFVSSRRRVVR